MEKNKEDLEKLENMREQLNNINKVMTGINQETETLKQNETVQNYIYYKKQYGKLEKEKDHLIEDITCLDQELCNHPLFYYLSSDPIDFGSKNTMHIKCLKCGKELSEHPRNINHELLIKSDLEYYQIKKQFNDLGENQLDENEAAIVLVKRYNK